MKNTTKENLKLWRSVCVTNPEWIKSANLGGRKISAINPQKQLKQASEIWGSYGSVWGLKDCKRNILDLEQSNKLIILEAVFFYPSGSFEISLRKSVTRPFRPRYRTERALIPSMLETVSSSARAWFFISSIDLPTFGCHSCDAGKPVRIGNSQIS